MPHARYSDRRDENEAEIVAAWRERGALVIPQPRSAGFDLLIVLGGLTIMVEVKNPATRWMLTDAETALRDELAKRGRTLHVQQHISEIPDIIARERSDTAALLRR